MSIIIIIITTTTIIIAVVTYFVAVFFSWPVLVFDNHRRPQCSRCPGGFRTWYILNVRTFRLGPRICKVNEETLFFSYMLSNDGDWVSLFQRRAKRWKRATCLLFYVEQNLTQPFDYTLEQRAGACWVASTTLLFDFASSSSAQTHDMTRDSERTTWKNMIEIHSIRKREGRSQDFSSEHAELFGDFFLLRN
jgi:hypothetical protein